VIDGSRRSRVRVAFAVYACGLALVTHWPALRAPIVGLSRSDMVAHVGVFGVWAALMLLCGWFGPVLSARNIVVGFLVALAYAGLDEGTQAIPAVKRYAGWDDFAANVMGVCCGVAAVAALGALHASEPRDR